MALSYMLDTDTCIYVMEQSRPAMRLRLDAAAGRICMSAVTFGELAYGAEKSQQVERNLTRLMAFRSLVPVAELGEAPALHYGQIRAGLRRLGTPIGPNDTLIAAHARAMGLTMVTNNVREFSRVPGLAVENWVG